MIPGTCPRCGAGVAAEDGKPCRSERSAVYECYTSVVNDGRDYRLLQSSVCVARETPFLRARVRELEARVERLVEAGDKMLSAWLMPEDSIPYADWVDLSSDAKRGWYVAKEAKP